VRRDNTRNDAAGVDRVVATAALHQVLPEADFVCLACPLTPATERLIDARALAAMKRGAWLVNVARGRVVDEPALIAALERGQIAGAALDCAEQEPLPASSPLWAMENVLITPHSAGETRAFEARIIDQLLANLDHEAAGRALINQVGA
jgi:D-2-hydroxyacid dehydrogenase (NADP+)